MPKLSYKSKIQVLIAGWFLVAIVLFGYLFDILDNSNLALMEEINGRITKEQQLIAEQKSYQLAKQDLEKLQGKSFQPDNLFSRDTSLVREIQTLENLAQEFDIDMNLGVAGSVGTAPKAPDTSEELMVPYNLQLVGRFNNIVQFLESIEALPFVTTVNGLSISPVQSGIINVGLSAFFYIKK